MSHRLLATPLTRRLAVLLGAGAFAMVAIASTTFVGPGDPRISGQSSFSAEEYAAEMFPELAEAIRAGATELASLAAAVADDPDAAGAQYGVDLGAGRYVFPVTATGPVEEVDDDFIYLAVPDPADPEQPLDVRIPLGSALSGTPVRDAPGTIQFGDFADQNEYQSVANELKLVIQAQVLAPADPPSLAGQVVTVAGAWVLGGPADIFIVQPVAIEVVR